VKFAYADPPYLGCGRLYADERPDAIVCDDPTWHAQLIGRITQEYPDGWALSASTPSLRTILPMCPSDVRVMAWVKPFASFKPNVGVAYAWEPVIVRGGRPRTRQQPTVRDWFSHEIMMRKGLTGAKPPAFVHWVMDVLNVQKGDEMFDLFPGTGIVERCATVRVSGMNSLDDLPLGWLN
jgi:hypothetical protein